MVVILGLTHLPNSRDSIGLVVWSKLMNPVANFIIAAIVMAVAYYFLVYRKTLEAKRKVEADIEAVGAGDRILTKGGLLGDVRRVEEGFLLVEVGEGVMVRVVRTYIASVVAKAEARAALAA